VLNVTLIINGVVSGNLIVKRIEIEDIFIEPGKINKFVECYYNSDIVYTVVCDTARLENKWPDEIKTGANLDNFKNLIIKFRGINFDKEL